MSTLTPPECPSVTSDKIRYADTDQGDRCVAEAETVVVQIDESTRRALPLSSHARERLGKLVLERGER